MLNFHKASPALIGSAHRTTEGLRQNSCSCVFSPFSTALSPFASAFWPFASAFAPFSTAFAPFTSAGTPKGAPKGKDGKEKDGKEKEHPKERTGRKRPAGGCGAACGAGGLWG